MPSSYSPGRYGTQLGSRAGVPSGLFASGQKNIAYDVCAAVTREARVVPAPTSAATQARLAEVHTLSVSQPGRRSSATASSP